MTIGDPVEKWPVPLGEEPPEGTFAVLTGSSTDPRINMGNSIVGEVRAGGGTISGTSSFPCVKLIPFAVDWIVVVSDLKPGVPIDVPFPVSSIQYFAGAVGYEYSRSSLFVTTSDYYCADCTPVSSSITRASSLFLLTEPPDPKFTKYTLRLEIDGKEGGGASTGLTIQESIQSPIDYGPSSFEIQTFPNNCFDAGPVQDIHTPRIAASACLTLYSVVPKPKKVDWVGFVVGMQHADERDVRRIVWRSNP